MSASVFEKLHLAASTERGVELTAAEVWLLWDLAGGELGKAEAEYEKWQERFEELDLMNQRAAEEDGGK